MSMKALMTVESGSSSPAPAPRSGVDHSGRADSGGAYNIPVTQSGPSQVVTIVCSQSHTLQILCALV